MTRSVALILLTAAGWAAYVSVIVLQEAARRPDLQGILEAAACIVVVTVLTFSAAMYLAARHAALLRFRDHRRVPRGELNAHFARWENSVTVLVPSYAEEPEVVRTTLWSAALQEFPHLRVVLLIDDAPFPSDPAALARLQQTRGLAADIEAQLADPYRRFHEALRNFEAAALETASPTELDVMELVDHYDAAARWLENMAEDESVEDHADRFFTEQVVRGLARDLRRTGRALNEALAEGSLPPVRLMADLYRRLTWIFRAEVSVFERKRYASLSHEANKAMNLNSYLGLMGRSWHEEHGPSGLILRPAAAGYSPDFHVPDAGYVLTLDADSVLLPDYCLRLVYLLESAGNERVAVAQTPYSSFPGASTELERLAGATTDLQHLQHQGKTFFGATYWVGANAVIRKRALEEIRTVENVGGLEISRYIQDRTVIEDTESSIDLGMHGWTLYNYPERLSYSATPPDFGSLVVQRRRWANGGLIILPKLLRQLADRRHRREHVGLGEMLLRLDYLGSIAWSSVGILVLLAYPFSPRLLSPLVFLCTLPYFWAMSADLRYLGYRRSDVLRTYGLNMLLLSVNLAGVLKSVQQALTREKIPFARTPKIKDRTAAPALHVAAPYLIVGLLFLNAWRNTGEQNWVSVALALVSVLLCVRAIGSCIGLRNSVTDLAAGVAQALRRKPSTPTSTPSPAPQRRSWAAEIYWGDTGR